MAALSISLGREWRLQAKGEAVVLMALVTYSLGVNEGPEMFFHETDFLKLRGQREGNDGEGQTYTGTYHVLSNAVGLETDADFERHTGCRPCCDLQVDDSPLSILLFLCYTSEQLFYILEEFTSPAEHLLLLLLMSSRDARSGQPQVTATC